LVALSGDDHPFNFIIVVDLDYLAHYNDILGFNEGNVLLERTWDFLSSVVHADKLFRYGGDEFVLLGEAANETDVGSLCEGMREGFEALGIAGAYWRDGQMANRPVTISLGFLFFEGSRGGSAKALMEQAYRYLQMAKNAGGNRVAGGFL
jgi:diguanylate cyclase (GGDEF)-like protein